LTPLVSNRIAAETSPCPAKHKRHGTNLQLTANPDRDVPRAPGAPPGPARDNKPERTPGITDEPEVHVGLADSRSFNPPTAKP